MKTAVRERLAAVARRPVTLGGRLKELRAAAGVSQRRLAEGVSRRTGQGFDFTYLSKIETDKMVPSREVVLALAAELDASADELLALSGRPPEGVAELLVKSEGARRFYRAAVEARLSEAEWDVMLAAMDRITTR